MQKKCYSVAGTVLVSYSAPKEGVPEQPSIEFPVEEEVVPPAETEELPKTVVPDAVAEQNVSENGSAVVEVPKKEIPQRLTAARQEEYFPAVEKAVLESPCYQLSWVDFEKYANSSPLVVEKSVRYEYRERLQWKGWILYKLFRSRNLLASEMVAVIIDDGNVSCPRAGPFTIDWQDSLKRLRNR